MRIESVLLVFVAGVFMGLAVAYRDPLPMVVGTVVLFIARILHERGRSK